MNCSCCRPALHMPGGHRSLAESKSFPSEPSQNTGHMAGLSTTACQARHGHRARLVIQCMDPGDGPWVWRSDLQLSVVVKPCRRSLLKRFYRLRQLRPAVRCSSEDAVKTIVQAFVISRLNYWITVTCCATASPTNLQSRQNAATRLVMGTRWCDHISPVLRQLHWLPVRQRIVFKIVTLVHRSFYCNAPG